MEKINKRLYSWASLLEPETLAQAEQKDVMADSADLVEIRYTLRQLVNVKGD